MVKEVSNVQIWRYGRLIMNIKSKAALDTTTVILLCAFVAAAILNGCGTNNALHSETVSNTDNVAQSSQTGRRSTNVINEVNSASQMSTNIANTSASAIPERVSFRSAGGVEIVGSFYRSPNRNSPAVLMLHQWAGKRGDYDRFAKHLQAHGINGLAIDGRGFGESVRSASTTEPVAPSRTNDAVAAMLMDVRRAVEFLRQQPTVDANRIAIIGASYGSSLALIYAADDPTIKAVALLSPGLNYFGNLPTEPAMQRYGARPLLLVSAADDAESAIASRRLHSLVTGDAHHLKIYDKGGHGTNLFAPGLNLEQLLEEFFAAHF